MTTSAPLENGQLTRDSVRLAEHLFRHESGKLVSLLTRTFGVDRLQLAEDVVQETLIRALQTWPYYGIPDNPAAWITQTAKNLALDHVRRENNFRDKEPNIAASAHRWTAEPGDASESIFFDDELSDNRLRMMFACCHPLIPQDARVALTLKTLCGFNIPEIAKAFLTTEAAVAKRLTRARQRIREARIPFEIPTGDEVLVRLESVEQSLYLLFNEGYKASVGESLIREELCREAIGLTNLLTQHPVGNQPRTHALLALMLLNAARLPARLDADGHILLLKEQDRSLWDQSLVAQGMAHLARSAAGDELSAFHLEAGIAACHCMARDYASTDWPRILSLYDRLAELDDSPVVALNRAVAIAQVHGPQAGIEAVESIPKRAQLFTYHLLYAVLGEFESQLDNHAAAATHFRRALDLTEIKSERLFLLARIQDCESRNGR
ncbi:MAG: sigma-70 family RNA polymerase sigma factor [Candidatus Hydrogenedentes bacterium]|nr:sigma-70 family RNA polymerase sigma factor [Candidatus Hydrogenedentota bacterium]